MSEIIHVRVGKHFYSTFLDLHGTQRFCGSGVQHNPNRTQVLYILGRISLGEYVRRMAPGLSVCGLADLLSGAEMNKGVRKVAIWNPMWVKA